MAHTDSHGKNHQEATLAPGSSRSSPKLSPKDNNNKMQNSTVLGTSAMLSSRHDAPLRLTPLAKPTVSKLSEAPIHPPLLLPVTLVKSFFVPSGKTAGGCFITFHQSMLGFFELFLAAPETEPREARGEAHSDGKSLKGQVDSQLQP